MSFSDLPMANMKGIELSQGHNCRLVMARWQWGSPIGVDLLTLIRATMTRQRIVQTPRNLEIGDAASRPASPWCAESHALLI